MNNIVLIGFGATVILDRMPIDLEKYGIVMTPFDQGDYPVDKNRREIPRFREVSMHMKWQIIRLINNIIWVTITNMMLYMHWGSHRMMYVNAQIWLCIHITLNYIYEMIYHSQGKGQDTHHKISILSYIIFLWRCYVDPHGVYTMTWIRLCYVSMGIGFHSIVMSALGSVVKLSKHLNCAHSWFMSVSRIMYVFSKLGCISCQYIVLYWSDLHALGKLTVIAPFGLMHVFWIRDCARIITRYYNPLNKFCAWMSPQG